MANSVKLHGDPAVTSLPNLYEPVGTPSPRLASALEAYQNLKLDVRAQSRPLGERREVTRFLHQFGEHLYRTLIQNSGREPSLERFVQLQIPPAWSAYPWELLHDGAHWLAVQQGISRIHRGSPHTHRPRDGSSFRIAAVSARPLPGAEDGMLAAQYRDPGARFIQDPASILPTTSDIRDGHAIRHLPHATAEEWRELLANPPQLLIWSGFNTTSGWWLENTTGKPVLLALREVTEGLGQAAGKGLQVLLLADSLGLADPAGASRQSQQLLQAGLPAVIRIEGVQSRIRARDYTRILIRHLANGESVAESHLSSVRRLYRRFEESWDWSFPRLYHGESPTPQRVATNPDNIRPYAVSSVDDSDSRRTVVEDVVAAPFLDSATAMMGESWQQRLYPTLPPPALWPRHRVFGRHEELRTLIEGLNPSGPELPRASPFVFLNGPPGIGKSALAIEIAHRLRRRFDDVIYLDRSAVLLPPSENSSIAIRSGTRPFPKALVNSSEWLLATIGRHIGCPPAADTADAVADTAGEGGSWATLIEGQLQDGRSRLLILDGLDHHPGYEGCMALLQKAPPITRILVIGRGKVPFLAGIRIELAPIKRGDLARITSPELLQQLVAHPEGVALGAACCLDLLLARVLARLGAWPPNATIAKALAPDPTRNHPSTGRLLMLCVRAAAVALTPAAQDLLRTLLLCGTQVSRGFLGHVSDYPEKDVTTAISELQWVGLAEAFDDERMIRVPYRLQSTLAEEVLGGAACARLIPRIALTQQSFIGEAAEALQHQDELQPWAQAARALSWTLIPGRGFANSIYANRGAPDPARWFLRRLGVERVTLAELSLLLAEINDAKTLARLLEEARPLAEIPWLADLHITMAYNLYSTAQAAGDTVTEAKALNRMGAALLADQDAKGAVAVLVPALDRLGNQEGWDTLWETYLLLSRAYEHCDQLDAASNLLNSAVELAYQLDDGTKVVTALRTLVRLWRHQNMQHELAAQVLPRAVTYLQRRQQTQQVALVLTLLAECQQRSENLTLAEITYRKAIAAFIKSNGHADAATARLGLAEVLCNQKQPEEAWHLAKEAASELGNAGGAGQREVARVMEAIAHWSETHNRPQLALEAYLYLRKLHEHNYNAEALIRILDRLGGVYFQLQRQEDSTRCYKDRLRLQANN